jgi:hypothetical protein
VPPEGEEQRHARQEQRYVIMNVYGGADDAIRAMNRRNLKAFDRLRLMKKDELNIIRMVSETYDRSAKEARTRYY